MFFLSIKALHLIAVIAWLVGLFYLPRIFVHYAEGREHGEDVRRLVTMARRLFGFMTLMAAFAITLGLWLWLGFHDSGRWLMVKLALVAGLIGYHLICGALLKRARAQGSLPSSRRLRVFNKAALLLVAPIIFLSVLKPL